MTSNAQHTPTPWFLSGSGIRIRDKSPEGNDIAWAEPNFAGGFDDVSRANAAFIVRACNAHEELVAALELQDKATTTLVADGEKGVYQMVISFSSMHRLHEAYEKRTAALAKARGQA